MVGKTVMGGMKVTCQVDEDVGAAVGRLGHTGAVAGDLLPGHPLSSMPTSRESGSLGLTGNHPVSPWSPDPPPETFSCLPRSPSSPGCSCLCVPSARMD